MANSDSFGSLGGGGGGGDGVKFEAEERGEELCNEKSSTYTMKAHNSEMLNVNGQTIILS